MALRVIAFVLAASLLAALSGCDPSVDLPELPAGATGQGGMDGGEPRVDAFLLVNSLRVEPGKPLRVGVLFRLDRGWHLYWKNPGQTGFPTELRWSLDGGRVGPTRWPAPGVFLEDEGQSVAYGYADEVLLFHEATFEGEVDGMRRIAVEAEFLVCEVTCIPGKVELEREIAVGALPAEVDPEAEVWFRTFSPRVPRPARELGIEVSALYSQSAIRPGDSFQAALSVGTDLAIAGDPTVAFVPELTEGVEIAAVDARPLPGGHTISLAGRPREDATRVASRLRGVLALRGADGDAVPVEIDVPLPGAPPGAEFTAQPGPWIATRDASPPPPSLALSHALALALLGGLILNLMPCVLPVLAIKAVAVAELAHHSRRQVLTSGAAYAVGVLASMALLAGVVIALRSAGTAVGWGFQFQEPLFVVAVCAVLVVMALNLFGVFEITWSPASGIPVGGGVAQRSVLDGLLAVVVATPCSAPFLGTAVGFAFASSAAVIVSVFLAVGAGLALPFVLVTLVPGWSRLIPRSGPWMMQLRRVLGFALIASVVWLLWIVGRVAGADAMTGTLAFLVMLSFAIWAFGAHQATGRDRRGWLVSVPIAVAAVAGLAIVPLEPLDVREGEPARPGLRTFERAAVAAELDLGRPVFVYFTADWCLTCKVNERVVLSDTRVEEALDRLGFVTFEADWTLRDEGIREELARFGKSGVPVYLVYAPSAPGRPQVLPELLTVDLLVDALEGAAARAS